MVAEGVGPIGLVHQHDQLLYPDILFNRPISGLSRVQVALFGGRPGHLSVLSDAYIAIEALKLTPTCIVQSVVPRELLPVGSMTLNIQKKTGQIEQTAAVLDYAQRANTIIMAPEAEFGSAFQILAEKVFATSSPLILTDELIGLYEFLPEALRRRTNNLLFLSTEGLMKLSAVLKLPIAIRPGRGIYNTITLADAVGGALNAHVIAYSSELIVVRDREQEMQRGIIHINLNSGYQPGLMLGLMSGLLADARHQYSHVFENALTAGYLYNTISAASEAGRPISQTALRAGLEKELG